MSHQTKILEKLVVWFKCFSSNSELILSDKQHLMRLLMNLSDGGLVSNLVQRSLGLQRSHKVLHEFPPHRGELLINWQ